MNYEIIFFRAFNTYTAQSGQHRHTAIYLPAHNTAFSTGDIDVYFSTQGPNGPLRSAIGLLRSGVYYRQDMGHGYRVFAGQTKKRTSLQQIAAHAAIWSECHPENGSPHYPHNCRGYAESFIIQFSSTLAIAKAAIDYLDYEFQRCQ